MALGITIAWRVPPLAALAAVLIAFGSVQLGFVGHDAGHRAVFRSTAPTWHSGQCAGAWCWGSDSATGTIAICDTTPT
jgi:hypothetical protein